MLLSGIIAGQLPNYLTQAEIEAISASNIDAITDLPMTISDPPLAVEVDLILQKLNEAVLGLHR